MTDQSTATRPPKLTLDQHIDEAIIWAHSRIVQAVHTPPLPDNVTVSDAAEHLRDLHARHLVVPVFDVNVPDVGRIRQVMLEDIPALVEHHGARVDTRSLAYAIILPTAAAPCILRVVRRYDIAVPAEHDQGVQAEARELLLQVGVGVPDHPGELTTR